MDWLSFISSVISSLAWPITIIFSFLVLKDPIVKLIPYVRRFQYKDLNVEFGEMAEKAEIALPSELGGIIDHMRVPISVLQEIAEVSPKSAVIEAWRSVEFELNQVAKHRELPSNARSSYQIIECLQRDGLIYGPIATIMHELRSLRNEAVHASDVELSEDSVNKYIITANNICNFLRSIH